MSGRGDTNQRNQRQPFAEQGELGPIATVQAELQELLEDKKAPASEIKRKIIELREEKEKAEQRLAAARNELRELLTIRQEALLREINRFLEVSICFDERLSIRHNVQLQRRSAPKGYIIKDSILSDFDEDYKMKITMVGYDVSL